MPSSFPGPPFSLGLLQGDTHTVGINYLLSFTSSSFSSMKKITTGGYKLDVMTEEHFSPCQGKEMPSHICLYLEVPIMAFFFSGDPPQIFATEGTRIPQEIYELKHQTELFLPTNTLPFLSLYIYIYIRTFICMSAHIFYYPFKICVPLMFHLYTRGHTQVSARPRHFQNHSMIFCMELLRIEPII